MSKRPAEKQGGKYDLSDDEIEEVGTEFKAADPSVLATRKIKPLPKRDAQMNKLAAPKMPTPPPGGRFAGFVGFTPTSTSSALPPLSMTTTSNPFGNFKTNGTAPVMKQIIPESSVAAPPPLTPHPTEPIEEDNAELLTGYRGLNQTFMEIVRVELKKDPFVDISTILGRYQKCRETLRQTSSHSAFTKFEPPPSWTTSGQKTESKKTAPPKPMKPSNSMFDFGAPPPSASGAFQFESSSSASKDDPWKTRLAATQDPGAKFTFTPIIPSPPKTSPNPFVAAYIANTESPKTQEKKTTPTIPFSFPSLPSNNAFTFGAGSTSSKSGFTFGATLPTFGSTLTPSTTPPTTTPTSPGRAGSIGNPVGFTFGSPKGDKQDPVPSNEITKPSGFAAFGAFGVQEEKSSEAIALTKPGSYSLTETPSGTSKPTLLQSSGALTPGLTPVIRSREETPQSEATATEGTNVESIADETQPTHDEVYEGEEDETSIYGVKAKISKLIVKDDKGEWSTMGVGLLKLKRHNETGVLRILHRDTASRRIIINSRLFKGLNVTVAGARLLKLGLIEDQKIVQYLVRVPTEQDCKDLKSAIDEQVVVLDSTP